MKKFLTLSLCCLGSAAMLCSCGNRSEKGNKDAAQETTAAADSAALAEQTKRTMEKIASLPAEPVFDIVTSMGVIKVKLYSGTPKHRENFAKLALEKYYDGILFHRVIPNFMIQAGDPLTKDAANADKFGTGGPGYTVPAEFVSEYTHKKGALAAARMGDVSNPMKASSGSQFYIVQSEEGCRHLDGEYTVFGETIEGLDIIDKIAAVATDNRNRPLTEVKIITVKLDENQ